MELNGEQRIEAPRQKVWDALNDPQVLKACIPGCQSLDQHGDDAFEAVVIAKVGPVKAKFNGRVNLSNIRPPESYTITGEGRGGAAGMAKGGADVTLLEDGNATLLQYKVKADVGGKIAQIGSRLISSTANKYARDFFSDFGDIVTGKTQLPEAASATLTTAAAAPTPVVAAESGQLPQPSQDANVAHIRRLNWVLLAIIVVLLSYILVTA